MPRLKTPAPPPASQAYTAPRRVRGRRPGTGLACLALGAALAAGLPATPLSADVVDPRHNFLLEASGPGEICRLCHGRERDPAEREGVAGFSADPRSGPAFAEYGEPGSPPDWVAANVSVVCLSCHDGVTGRENRAGRMRGVGNHHTDLYCGHPISVAYGSFAASSLGGFATAAALSDFTLMYQGRVECVSCHDVHQDTLAPSMLRGEQGITALCLACHPR